MNAATTQHFRSYLLAVVADDAATVVAIYCSAGSAVVASTDDPTVFNND
jgi:hypothetical protein